MASFQAKIGWIRQIKRENKNCRSVPFRSVPTRCIMENFKKKARKLKILKKYHYCFISIQNRLEKPEKKRK